jgi:hypothetical protein
MFIRLAPELHSKEGIETFIQAILTALFVAIPKKIMGNALEKVNFNSNP